MIVHERLYFVDRLLLCFNFQAVELAMKFVSDRAYDIAKIACPRLAEIKCYEQVCGILTASSFACVLIFEFLYLYKVKDLAMKRVSVRVYV